MSAVNQSKWSIELILWCLFLLLFPFYIFPSGTPQPADYLMSALIFLMLISNKTENRLDYVDYRLRPVMDKFILFLLYSTLITSIWGLIIGNIFILINPLFYIYNFFVFKVALKLYFCHKNYFFNITIKTIFVSVIVEVILSFILSRSHLRQIVTFNNPNQLGYYALLCSSIYGFHWQILKLIKPKLIIGLIPTLMYGLTHQGLRFTLYWVLLALGLCINLDLDRKP